MMNIGEKHLYDWQYGRAGHFITHLMECISRADRKNTAKLKLAFPEEVEAYEKYSNEDGYWSDLKLRITDFYNKGFDVPEVSSLQVKNG